MTRNIFWLILAMGIIMFGLAIKSEAKVNPASSGISLANEACGGQTGNSGKTSSGGCQRRVGASGNGRQRIP